MTNLSEEYKYNNPQYTSSKLISTAHLKAYSPLPYGTVSHKNEIML